MSSNSTHPLRLQDLPVDIFLIFIEHLELYDLFLLSQTSRAMRYFAKRDWRAELSNKTRRYKLNFFSSLACALPDRWAYGACVCLHEVDPYDAPAANSAGCDDNMTPNWCGSYRLQHRHVQLALNYARRGGLYRDALSMMLSTYKISYKHAKEAPYIKYRAVRLVFVWRIRETDTAKVTARTHTDRRVCIVLYELLFLDACGGTYRGSSVARLWFVQSA
jgi:hypothetical protein